MFKNKPLYFQQWNNKGIEQMKDIIHTEENRLLKSEEITRKLGRNRADTIFEYNALYNAIPKQWINWIQNGRHTEEATLSL